MAVTTSNVRFWHELEEGSGTSIADENGGGAGTLTGGSWTTTGPTGISTNCVSFSAAINQHRISTAGTTVGQVAFAASAWFLKAAASQQGGLFASSSVTAGDHVFEIRIDSSGNVSARVVNPGVGNDFAITSSGTDYRNGAWHHVVFQRDSSGNAELFVDNVSKGTASNTTAITGSKTCIIGNQFDADFSTDFNLAGKASQAVLFDAILDSTDRSSLYNAGAGKLYSSFFSAGAVSTTPRRRMMVGIGA